MGHLKRPRWQICYANMAPRWSKNGTKMDPRWPQDGPKMASWRVLEPLGGQDGPKMEPRGFQERKSQFVPPMLGPKLGPNFGKFWHQSELQEASRSTWMTCCVKTPIFKRKLASRDPPEPLKIWLSLRRRANLALVSNLLVGWLLGTIFG